MAEEILEISDDDSADAITDPESGATRLNTESTVTAAQILLPPKLIDVFRGEAMFRGAYGGRGSAKTRSFAKMATVRALMWATEGREGINSLRPRVHEFAGR
jgi:hypothetical protein